jgi:hypothetical protein
VTWDRAPVAAALVEVLTAATAGLVTIHPKPPNTVNAPAVVVSRVESVAYSAAALGIDAVVLPVVIAGGADQDDAVDQLKATVRAAIAADWMLGGIVQSCVATEERNWRLVNSAGIDLLAVDLILTIQM